MKLFYEVFVWFLFFTFTSINSKEDRCDCVKLVQCTRYKHLCKTKLVRSEFMELKKISCKNKTQICCPDTNIKCHQKKPNKTITAPMTELPVPCNNNMVKTGECIKKQHCSVSESLWGASNTNCSSKEHICCPVKDYIKIDYDFNKAKNCGSSGKCVNFRDCPTYQHLLDLVEIDEENETIWKDQFNLCSGEKICCPIIDLQKQLLPSISDCRVRTKLIPKIKNGANATASEFPWIATIHYEQNNVFNAFSCYGELITIKHILTAAHCVNKTRYQLNYITLRTDNSPSAIDDRYDIDYIIHHESYKPRLNEFDIAIVGLARWVQNRISPICLPINWDRDTAKFLKAEKVIVGYHKKRLELLKVNVNLTTPETCKGTYDKPTYSFSHLICANSSREETEIGDSGIALAAKMNIENDVDTYWVAIGIHIAATSSDRDPGLYTNVSVFMTWIINNLK